MVVRPNQEVKLTLLADPHGLIHATMGLLPRKDVGIRLQGVAEALARISPTFRLRPVLVDSGPFRCHCRLKLSEHSLGPPRGHNNVRGRSRDKCDAGRGAFAASAERHGRLAALDTSATTTHEWRNGPDGRCQRLIRNCEIAG